MLTLVCNDESLENQLVRSKDVFFFSLKYMYPLKLLICGRRLRLFAFFFQPCTSQDCMQNADIVTPFHAFWRCWRRILILTECHCVNPHSDPGLMDWSNDPSAKIRRAPLISLFLKLKIQLWGRWANALSRPGLRVMTFDRLWTWPIVCITTHLPAVIRLVFCQSVRALNKCFSA